MTDRELMQQALEALEFEASGWEDPPPITREAITALRERLAQPEQEPVIDKSAAIRIATALGWEPRREWQGLTDEEIVQTLGNVRERLDGNVFGDFARAIEAKLREKNT